jgi:hypothetical protein
MFKSALPANCPPSEVEEQERVLYRLVVPGDPVESFKNHVELFPEKKDYLKQCIPHGISFFDNLKPFEDLLSKENNTGKAIAKVEIKKNHGVLTKKPSKKGHYTLWAYDHFDPATVNMEIVK